MADIFGYNRTAASGVFVADKSKLTITGASGVDLIQGWSIQYQQSISPIYEVGSSRLFWAKGTPLGSGSISRIVGSSFLSMSGETCDRGKTLTITNASGSCETDSVSITCLGALCTSIGFSSQAGNPTVAEQASFQFTGLEVA